MIYLIVTEDSKFCHIGYTTDTIHKLYQLQELSPMKLHLIKVVEGNAELEARLHKLFSPYKAHGGWFNMHEDISDFFKLNEEGFLREFLSTDNKNIMHKYGLTTDILADYFDFASPQSFRSSSAYSRYMEGVTKLIRHIQRELLAKIS